MFYKSMLRVRVRAGACAYRYVRRSSPFCAAPSSASMSIERCRSVVGVSHIDSTDTTNNCFHQ
jgi:hypothetical protein